MKTMTKYVITGVVVLAGIVCSAWADGLTPEQKLAQYKAEQEARKEYARKVFSKYDFDASHHVDVPAGLKKYLVIEGVGENWKELAELHKDEDWIGIINSVIKKRARHEGSTHDDHYEEYPDKRIIDNVVSWLDYGKNMSKLNLRIRIKWIDDFPGVPLEVYRYDESRLACPPYRGKRLRMKRIEANNKVDLRLDLRENPMMARENRRRNQMQTHGDAEEFLVLEEFSPNKSCRIYMGEYAAAERGWRQEIVDKIEKVGG